LVIRFVSRSVWDFSGNLQSCQRFRVIKLFEIPVRFIIHTNNDRSARKHRERLFLGAFWYCVYVLQLINEIDEIFHFVRRALSKRKKRNIKKYIHYEILFLLNTKSNFAIGWFVILRRISYYLYIIMPKSSMCDLCGNFVSISIERENRKLILRYRCKYNLVYILRQIVETGIFLHLLI